MMHKNMQQSIDFLFFSIILYILLTKGIKIVQLALAHDLLHLAKHFINVARHCQWNFIALRPPEVYRYGRLQITHMVPPETWYE